MTYKNRLTLAFFLSMAVFTVADIASADTFNKANESSGVEVKVRETLPGGWLLLVTGLKNSSDIGGCSVRRQYKPHPKANPTKTKLMTLMVSAFAGKPNVVTFSVTGQGWQLTQGKNYEAKMKFDKTEMGKAVGQGSENWVDFVDVTDKFLSELRAAKFIFVTIAGNNLGGFGLKGSTEALNALDRCRKYLGASSGDTL